MDSRSWSSRYSSGKSRGRFRMHVTTLYCVQIKLDQIQYKRQTISIISAFQNLKLYLRTLNLWKNLERHIYMLTRNTGYFFQPPCILTTAGAKTQKYSHGVFSHNILVSCYPHLTLHQTNPTPPATSHLNQNRSKLLFFIALHCGWSVCWSVCIPRNYVKQRKLTNI